MKSINLEIYCPGEFDDLICWPYSKNETMIGVPCPNYLKANITGNISRFYVLYLFSLFGLVQRISNF